MEQKKYRKKTEEFKAKQWFPDTPDDSVVFPIPEKYVNDFYHYHPGQNIDLCGMINTGIIIFVLPGDYIATYPDGNRTMIWKDKFEREYELFSEK
jgi:hypothetical protein